MASSSFFSQNGAKGESYAQRALGSAIMPGSDHYRVLDVDPGADPESIKRAFRAKARECHPDRNPADPLAGEVFQRVQHAYYVLGDPLRRREYDLARGLDADWPDGMERSASPFNANTDQSPDAEPRVDVSVSFDEALRGGHAQVPNAVGEIVKVTIPRGCRDGTAVRVKGRGDDSGADLLVTFRVRSHERFRREGNHLHVIEKVTVMEAMLGTQRTLVTPYGRHVRITIRPGTQPGERLRLRGLGVQTRRETGDLFVEIDVEVPRELTDDQKAQLRAAAEQLGLI